MIVCPKKLLPTLSHLVKLLYAARQYRIGPLAGAPPDTCAVVINTETESGFITEDDTSPVCHTPSCPRSAKIQSTLPTMWGQCEGILKSHSLSSLLNFLRAFGDGPVAGVSGGQGIESWLACLEFEPSATKDPP
ncbi:hypothetical protein TNCV_2245781 [Trichonephila clavipes]|nr:hypothetical protein TNCV_2245781 [Trichonephila clavipes]